jgi:hypothetical protein
MRMPASSGARSGVEVGGPGEGVAGVVREAGEGVAQASVAGPAEADGAGLPRPAGDGGKASVGGGLVGGEVARAILAEFGEDRGGADLSGAREAHEDTAVLH